LVDQGKGGEINYDENRTSLEWLLPPLLLLLLMVTMMIHMGHNC